jgi:hypothetical protein
VAQERTGSRGYGITNIGYGSLSFGRFNVSASTSYDVAAFARGEVDGLGSYSRDWQVWVHWHGEGGGSLSYIQVDWGTYTTLSTTWDEKGGTVTSPSNAVQAAVELRMENAHGWVAWDDVSMIEDGGSTNLVLNPGFESASNSTGNPRWALGDVTSFRRGTDGISAPRSGTYGYAITNMADGWPLSESVTVVDTKTYDVSVEAQGRLEDDSVGASWAVVVLEVAKTSVSALLRLRPRVLFAAVPSEGVLFSWASRQALSLTWLFLKDSTV